MWAVAFMPSVWITTCGCPRHGLHAMLAHQQTWISKADVGHRIDYVALPSCWQSYDVSSHVSTDIDLVTAQDDHFVAVVVVQMANRSSMQQF